LYSWLNPLNALPIGEAEPSLCTLQCLNGRLLIYADNNGILRRIQVQPDYVSGFLSKLGVGAHTPATAPLKMDTMPFEYPPDMVRRHIPQRLCQKAPRPCGISLWRWCVQFVQYSLLHLSVVLSLLAWPRRIFKPVQTVTEKPVAPLAHRGGTHLQHLGNLLCPFPHRALQHDAGSLYHAMQRRQEPIERKSIMFNEGYTRPTPCPWKIDHSM